jgi:hypothetical protein
MPSGSDCQVVDLTDRLRPAAAGPLAAADGFDDRPARLRRAIAAAVAYADLFDWPLTPDEIHRSLPIPARLSEVTAALAPARLGPALAAVDGFVVAHGREELVERRMRCAEVSAELWPRAARAARVVGRLPWVKMVAVSGSLAVGAATDDADVDLFIVADDGRVWLARAVTIGVAKAVIRLPSRRRVHLCPNYLIGESALDLWERDVYTAHELTQLVPVAGLDVYRSLLERNRWYLQFLPNAGEKGLPPVRPGAGWGQRLFSTPVTSTLFDRLERWEMTRKVARLRSGGNGSEVCFDATTCKGHFGGHRRRVLTHYAIRRRELERAVW